MPSTRQIFSPGKKFVRPGPTASIALFVKPTTEFEYRNQTFDQPE
jgi:hypothetical protein